MFVLINWHNFKRCWKSRTYGYDFIDLQNTFDTLDHKTLLGKMKSIGFTDKTINLFYSYLSFWLRRIYIRTFLFFLYINGIPYALSNAHTYLHVCGTSIFCQHKYVTEIENVLNKIFTNICNWFVDNKLSIHLAEHETKCILFSTDKNLPELYTTYNNNRIIQYNMVE